MTWLAITMLLAQDDLETLARRLSADEIEIRQAAMKSRVAKRRKEG